MHNFFLLVLSVSLFFLGVKQTYDFIEKGDTLIIKQADVMGDKSLDEIIRADTTESGGRAHAVYELAENAVYELKASLNYSGYYLNLTGSDVRTSPDARRPVILYSKDFEGYFGLEGGSISLKHIQWEQIENVPGGNIGPWARAGINILNSAATILLHDIVWDFNTGFLLSAGKDGTKLKVTNCLFRFNKDLENSVWTGQGFDLRAATLDTILFRDCTWYGGGAFLVCTWESTQKHFVMDHCTVADFVQFPIHGKQWDNTFFTNNLFNNAHTMGEDYHMRHSSDPDTLPYGIINIDTVYDNWQAETGRLVHIKNNNNYVSLNIKSYWYESMNDPDYNVFLVADPSYYDGFMNARARAMFEDDQTYPGLVIENTSSLDPLFADYFDYSDTLINYSRAFYGYANPDAVPTTFMLDPDGDPLTPTDPMVYDLKVNNPSLLNAATDGSVIGDRTWELPNGYNNPQITEMITGFEQDAPGTAFQPDNFTLAQNFPNPFNPAAVIEFTIKSDSRIKLTVYDVLGRQVLLLLDKRLPPKAEPYRIIFNAGNLASGIYFYRLEADNFVDQKKMVLIR